MEYFKSLKKMIFSHKNIEDSKLPNNIKNIFQILNLMLNIVNIDFSFAKYFADEIILELSKINDEKEKIKFVKNIRKEFKHFFQKFHVDYQTNPYLICYYNIKNLLLFIYILLYNLNECKEFYLIIFDKNNHLWDEIFDIGVITNRGEIEKIIYNIINDKFIIESLKKLSLLDYFKEFLNKYKTRKIPKNSIIKFDPNDEKSKLFIKKVKLIKKIDDSWFENNYFEGNSLNIIKLAFSNSLIRCLMSDNIIKIKSSESELKINMIEDLIVNYSEKYYTKYGNDINKLFCNNMIIEDILLNFSPNYASNLFIKYMNPLINLMKGIDLVKERKLFEEKFIEFINNIKNNLPKILIFICTTLQNEIQRNCSIAINDYTPIYIYLFKMFFFADKYKNTYFPEYPEIKKKNLINSILENILFDRSFLEDDNTIQEIKEFNIIVKNCHNKLKNAIEEIISDFEPSELDSLLKEEKEKNKIRFPDDFLFLYDSTFILIFIPKDKE